MPKISWHSYDIAVVAVRQDHISGVSISKVYRPWFLVCLTCPFLQMADFIVKIMLQEPWWLNQLDILSMQTVTKFEYVLNVLNLTTGDLWLVANLAEIIVIFTASIATNHRAPIVRFVTLGAYPNFATLCIDKMPNWFSNHRSWNFSFMWSIFVLT